MLPPQQVMQSEIRDGELRAKARGVESVKRRGLRAEEDGRRRSGSERCEIRREKDEREMDNTHKGDRAN